MGRSEQSNESHLMHKSSRHGRQVRQGGALFCKKNLLLCLLGILMMIQPGEVQAGHFAELRRLADDSATGDDDNSNLDESANQIIDGADQDTNDQTQPVPTAKVTKANDPAPMTVLDNAALAKTKAKARTRANVIKQNFTDTEMEDLQARYKKGDYRSLINSISPRGGPTTGKTRVTVRMNNLEVFADVYPRPKCKFGNNKMITEAAYIKCTEKPAGFYDRESSKGGAQLNATCIQCENNPAAEVAEIITFTVSLTGNFDDAESSHPYRYYSPIVVDSIYPRYGPKDGESVVQVWGKNFIDLGDDFRCNFGTKSTKAHFLNSGMLWCRSPQSDVVQRPMPFSVSMNRQQNSVQKQEYWFYNMQSIFKLDPDYGSMAGESKITLKGSNFKPFAWDNDIDNQNDTYCSFGPLGKRPAQVLSGTEAECMTPPNPQKLTNIPVKLSINNQNYTDEAIYFTYFNPPSVLEIGPVISPTKGGGLVDFWGQDFQKGKNITCSFGKLNTTGKFISKAHIQCPIPSVSLPGDVKLKISYVGDRFTSEAYNFKYYAEPQLTSLAGACGPVEGYTQFQVIGQHFDEQGFGKAKCIFNNTVWMNATVIDKNTAICDSPPLESVNGDMWYNISITMDGDFIANSSAKFKYYRQPKIYSVTPALGPLEGGTNSMIRGWGFNQTNVCDFTVRYEQRHIKANLINDTAFSVTSYAANVSGAVVVSVSGNNQQFIDDVTLHFRDKENTFEYYQAFIVNKVAPETISNAGNTPIEMTAMLFDQFKFDNATKRDVPILCRFLEDTEEGKAIGNEQTMKKVSNEVQICTAPETQYIGFARIELSVNGQQWQNTEKKVRFFNGPKVTSVNPTYGVTKNPKNSTIDIIGENFECPNNDCSKIKVRWTNDKGDTIIMDGTKKGSMINCTIPRYPAPETLNVDISMNGIDFTNDKVTYGFMDPYVLKISPRLISTKGQTDVTLYGYGFVQLEETKSQTNLQSSDQDLVCKNGAACHMPYKVINEHVAVVKSFPQEDVNLSGKNVAYSPFNIQMMDMDGSFASNGINLRYYKDIIFSNISTTFAYSNEEKPIILAADFSWGSGNDFQIFKKEANLTCRFTSIIAEGSSAQKKLVVMPAIMEVSPIGAYHSNQLPNQVRCRTPEWNTTEDLMLELSVNGLDYMGNFTITVVEQLSAVKISPLSGPIDGDTKVKFYGYGFMSAIPKETEVFIRFGSAESLRMEKSDVNDYEKWNDDSYHQELNLPKGLVHDAEENDVKLEEDQGLRTYLGASTPSIKSLYTIDKPDVRGMGGPVSITLSEKVPIQVIDHGTKKRGSITDYIETVYPESSNLEFYFYRNPFVQKIEPESGLATGGTMLKLTGGWFDQKPEYGVYPFCKIGDTIIRARFIQTNRIVCKTPPSNDISTPSSVFVSLNGVNWVDTKFTFSYYERPILEEVQPRVGLAEGGTEIFLKGIKFSMISKDMKTVKCRFRQMVNGTDPDPEDDSIPTRYVPAYFINATMMKCASPTGWIGGDKVKVDLTFNGVDFTESSFEFAFYQIFSSFPKSGPTDASNQFIQIKGKGFPKTNPILCSLNGKEVAPLQIRDNVIKCPMVLPDWPADKVGSVPFQILIDGVKHDFGNFYYYIQATIDNVSPLLGPNEGHGAIYFSGKGFRADFENAKLGCRIGNVMGSAVLVDSETIRCSVSRKVPLVDEGASLPVSVSLNSYSWIANEFSYSPYGILNMYPSSGPVNDNTNIIVVGKGFNNDMIEKARCKFGTDDNYQIVEGQVLDDEHMICKSPSESIILPSDASQEITIPFSVAFQEDMYYPYTESIHKFRLYNHPKTIEIDPVEASVMRLTEVYVYADPEQGFKQPVPAPGKNFIEQDQFGPKCKFGRFGTSPATYVNKTTILCLTPNIQEDPSDIYEETVEVSVALNGVDFNDELTDCQFTFTGTGGAISTWVIIMGTLIFGLLIVSVLVFISGLQSWMRSRNELEPMTTRNEMGQNQPRNTHSARPDRQRNTLSRRPGNLGSNVQSRQFSPNNQRFNPSAARFNPSGQGF